MYMVKYKHDKLDVESCKSDAERRIIRGIAHLQIVKACRHYLEVNRITTSQYNDLVVMVDAYRELGGNGSVNRVMQEIEKLPIIPDSNTNSFDKK